MPLDVTLSPSLSLDDRLAFHGIKPVPITLLEAHKREQLRRNPPSFFATKLAPVVFYLLSLVAVFSAWILPFGWSQSHLDLAHVFLIEILALYGAGLLAIVSYFLAGEIWRGMGHPIYGRPKWIEQRCFVIYDLRDHPQLREVVLRAQGVLPDAKLIYGKLVREEFVLDPYVVIEQHGERACLCIWDDDRVIACAEVIED